MFTLKDGSGLWASGYWELTENERKVIRRVFLHRKKADPSHWGGDVLRIVPAAEFAAIAARHATEPVDRWVLIVRPTMDGKGVAWEGVTHAMAYKSLS